MDEPRLSGDPVQLRADPVRGRLQAGASGVSALIHSSRAYAPTPVHPAYPRRYGNAKNASGRITCQHGANECAGNMQQACIVRRRRCEGQAQHFRAHTSARWYFAAPADSRPRPAVQIKYHPQTAVHLPILVCQERAYPQARTVARRWARESMRADWRLTGHRPLAHAAFRACGARSVGRAGMRGVKSGAPARTLTGLPARACASPCAPLLEPPVP